MTKYSKSNMLLERALKIIPSGAQSSSKSIKQFPYGISPYFIEKALGCRTWDVDGNEYIDFISGLLTVNLGYQDPDVDDAVRRQMNNGVIFSLSNILEIELAEKIIEMVPCAEMVKFGKNGSDVTSAAVRLARAYTKREHIAYCGYHGWHDWYAGNVPKYQLGVPEVVKKLTHSFEYNNIKSLENLFLEFPNQIAAVIMEPMHFEFPKENFLNEVKNVTSSNGTLLIFDEIITGFRVDEGGAQKMFLVTPDLACFSKGMANGYPLAALVGKGAVMKILHDTSFSLTFGGETLSIAASLATLTKIQQKKVPDSIAKCGNYLINGIQQLIYEYDLSNIVRILGHPSLTYLLFSDINKYTSLDIKTYYLQEVLKRGILTFGAHGLNYSHTINDIDYLLSVYDEVFKLLKLRIKNSDLYEKLECKLTTDPILRLS